MKFMQTTIHFQAARAVFLSAAVLASACDLADSGADRAPASQTSIVNGTEESGYPAVGALVGMWGGSGSAMCTATLIDPEWVLTAAHCVSWGGKPPGLYFYIGSDATNVAEDDPGLYAIASATPHPDYDPDLIVNDIALVHLSDPVDSAVATPIPANFQSIDDLEGEEAFYVGFGITTGSGSDSGIKRSTSIEIYGVGEVEYTSHYLPTETGFCSGDSGGPGMYDFGDGLRIIGVNSTGQQTDATDSCIGYYNDTRVDAFGEWISDTIGATPPNCFDDTDICYCDEACQGEADAGLCDNAACATATCGEAYTCYMGCMSDKPCESDCLVTAEESALSGVGGIYNCYIDVCLSATTYAELYDCIRTSCATEVATCCEVSMCNLIGGDCDESTSCRPSSDYPTAYGFSDCRATDTATYGEACDGSATDPTSCADGQYCLDSGEGFGALCHQLCRESTDCTLGGGECVKPIFNAPNGDVGYCDDDFSSTDTDADADAGADGGADADTDADTDTDADGGTDTAADEDCGCSTVGASLSLSGILAVLFG